MKKIISLSIVIGATLFGQEISRNKDIEEKILKFIEKSSPLEKRVFSKLAVEGSVELADGWHGVSVIFEKNGKPEREMFLSDGKHLAQNIIDMESNKDFKTLALEKFAGVLDERFYSKENLIYGEEGAKNRVVIFSNPLCPHCLDYFAAVQKYIKDNKELSVSIFYYPVALESVFPTTQKLIEVTERAKIALDDKSLDWKLYKALAEDEKLYTLAKEGKAEEVAKKIFGEFDLKKGKKEVKTLLKANEEKIDALAIKGTPTVYVNGVIDLKLQKIFTLGIDRDKK